LYHQKNCYFSFYIGNLQKRDGCNKDQKFVEFYAKDLKEKEIDIISLKKQGHSLKTAGINQQNQKFTFLWRKLSEKQLR
jgi:hypothetical protein